MKVRDLIRRLQAHDPNAQVVTHTDAGSDDNGRWISVSYVAMKPAVPKGNGYTPPATNNTATVQTVLIA